MFRTALVTLVLVGVSRITFALPPSDAAASPDLQTQVKHLETALAKTQAELSQSRDEIQELRRELQAIKSQLSPAASVSNKSDSDMYPTLGDLQQQPAQQPSDVADQEKVEELSARIAEQEQKKVESASRYRVRLSGLILMNTYSNFGHPDISDLPNLAFPRVAGQSHGDFGATLRQTLLGLEVAGPRLAGAATSADLQADFFGGFPEANYGVTAGLFRLRIARARMDWEKTSLVAGQDAPFFSPLSPTSYATVAEPALSWSGNLWVWTPQIRAEHRFDISETSELVLQGGILDSLTEQIPPMQFNRVPTAGEASRKPAIAMRTALRGKWFGRETSFGIGGFYGRQTYGYARNVDAWAATADWNLPLGSYFTLDGEFFRGRALGGLGGGIWNSVLYNGSPSSAASRLIGLDAVGGWSQLKFQPVAKWEFNASAGTDNPMASDLRFFATPMGSYFPPLVRNQTFFVNSIYKPKSNLLFALEYRRLRTYFLNGSKQSAGHLNLAVGVAF